MSGVRVGVFSIAAAVIVAGCSTRGDVSVEPPPLTPTVVGPRITEATWTEGPWPFTVSEGVVKCYAEDSMVTFTADGVEYGLNATAQRFGDFADIDDIVRDGPDGYVEINGTRQPVPAGVPEAARAALYRTLCR